MSHKVNRGNNHGSDFRVAGRVDFLGTGVLIYIFNLPFIPLFSFIKNPKGEGCVVAHEYYIFQTFQLCYFSKMCLISEWFQSSNLVKSVKPQKSNLHMFLYIFSKYFLALCVVILQPYCVFWLCNIHCTIIHKMIYHRTPSAVADRYKWSNFWPLTFSVYTVSTGQSMEDIACIWDLFDIRN